MTEQLSTTTSGLDRSTERLLKAFLVCLCLWVASAAVDRLTNAWVNHAQVEELRADNLALKAEIKQTVERANQIIVALQQQRQAPAGK